MGSSQAGGPGSVDSAPVAALPLLDRAVLSALRGVPGEGTGAVLGEILDLYRETAPFLVKRLLEALAAGDARAIERTAHALRGSSLNVGAVAVARFGFGVPLVAAAIAKVSYDVLLYFSFRRTRPPEEA